MTTKKSNTQDVKKDVKSEHFKDVKSEHKIGTFSLVKRQNA